MRSGMTAVALVLSLFGAGALSAEIQASARLSPERIGVAQTVLLTLEAQGSGVADLELDPSFSLENLEIVSGPMQSQTWQFVNGRASRAESLSWRLRPLGVGTARVRDLTLRVNDQTFALPEQAVEVQKDDVAMVGPNGRMRVPDPFGGLPFPRRRRDPSPAAEPKLFLRAEVTPKTPWVGQQVLYTLYLFTQANVEAISPETVPDFEGLWVQEIPQPEKLQPQMVELDGQKYGQVALLQKAIFPLRPGRFRLDPVEARIEARIPEFTWFGSVANRTTAVRRTSNAITIDVQALPEPPAEGVDFTGGVGKFRIQTQLEPRELRTGEAATLTVSVSGQGNIEGLQAPTLPPLDGIRVFPPEQKGGNRVSGTRIRGEKTWSYVLVPDRPGEWDLPALTYDYFDPWESGYRTSRSEPKLLRVLPELDTVDPVTLGEAPATETEVPGIESSRNPNAKPWYRQPVWLAPPVAIFALLMLWPTLSNLRRRNASAEMLRRRIRAVTGEARGRRAAEDLETAWRDYFVERFAISSQIATADWQKELRAKRVKRDVLDDLARLVEDLNYLRFAPELSASDTLRTDLIARSLRLSRSF